MAKIISVTVPEGTTYDIGAKYDIDGNEIKTSYLKTTSKGVASGVAGLDSSGKVPYTQLPPIGSASYDYESYAFILTEEYDAPDGFSPISNAEIDTIVGG